MKPVVLAAVLAAALAGCVTSGGSPGGSFCETARPQRPSRSEIQAMTPARQREVLAHNEFGAKACGWRP
ncbi:hypothetical protein FV232_17110 [Methylobacterium sp. WL30]|uniref:hypothetical protein n=1 Tax=Methylobacterium sp. WL18 TaxID=2603897 RepID=UPI0011CA4956|nr:hypothetical protein [Methylobacterium sp. WL18]TXN41700.1 hypothetical protein FV225_01530 [Methylobacterium sp. WL93]TXN51062.1 hypothetical protein FV227_09620 [Methylobacterium sp. WL119]TXN65810.1 hypothetical protein FV232_17110 [Methylobacterium sp. WL30]TXN75124.1 hypothetical protein FV228_04500 [Methylobacterium sp. WL18]